MLGSTQRPGRHGILDRMFPSDGDDAEAQELERRGSDAFVEALERIGVYVQTRQVVVHGSSAGPRTGLWIGGLLGRLAFSDQVQHPDQNDFDARFQDMADNLVEAEFEERRRALDD